MSSIKVSDTGSNAEENIERAAKALGRSPDRRKVFEAIYYHKKRQKTVAQLAIATGLDRKKILTHGKHLVESELVVQKKTGGETAYEFIPFYQHHKLKILSFVDNPSKLQNMSTKRRATIGSETTSLVKAALRRNRTRPGKKQPPNAIKKGLKIAFLVTNPERYSPLQTAIEARDVQIAINETTNRDDIDVKIVLAPRFSDLIDELNSYKPDILHFSGHAGGQSLLFDNAIAGHDGGVVLDFDTVSSLLESVRKPPELIVLAACDTVDGADRFLSTSENVVAMSDSVDDEAACAFSVRFYKSLASGATISHSLEQSKLSMKADGLNDADLPTLISKSVEAADKRYFD